METLSESINERLLRTQPLSCPSLVEYIRWRLEQYREANKQNDVRLEIADEDLPFNP